LRLMASLLVGILGLVCLQGENGPKLRSGKFSITQEDRDWWAFQPMKASGLGFKPGAIDQLIERELAKGGLKMNPHATPRELVRRATFDLLGLPPTFEDVKAFEADPSEAAWERLIDRLLASPAYGERMARHWLDLVRYAESNGYERDGAKPNAWRYRDYVIRSFNEDKPYDDFIREQIAGDELAADMIQRSDNREAWEQAMIATGFYRLHVWDDEPDSTIAAEYDDFDDILVTTSTAFLGITLGCARCHDHKFDPFSQADYYSMLSFFRGIDPYGLHKTGGGGRGTGKIERPLATPEDWKRWEEEKKARLKELERTVSGTTDATLKKQAEEELEKARRNRGPFQYALAAVEIEPKATHILARGDPASPRAEVQPEFPTVFTGGFTPKIKRIDGSESSGRRRALGNWIADPANPLTARVIANRLWQYHFGTGIVATPDDFGRTGIAPVNQPLLDELAAGLIADAWSLKRLHKRIMISRAYRMSSVPSRAESERFDEGNSLFWRQNLRRIEGEAIRDTLLAISGALNRKQGGPSVFPKLPPEVHGTQDAAGKGWADSPAEEQNRRSIYLVVKRALKVPLLECFDFANSASPVGMRNVTTTAPQALMLLNDSFVQAQAEHFATRLLRECGEDRSAQIQRAFELALQRLPTPAERKEAASFIASQGTMGLTSFCRALLNLNETIYIE
jgi:hypothetical protein